MAAVVWDAAVVLAEYLSKNPMIVAGRKVIELGAGTGLVGILCSQIGADVTVTDRPIALNILNENILLNRDNVTGSIRAEELSWGRNLDTFSQAFGVVLGADIVYVEETFDDLLATIKYLCRKDEDETIVFLSCRIRYERDRRFLSMLETDFKVDEIYYDVSTDVRLYSMVKKLPQ